jgi:hypothetical protein
MYSHSTRFSVSLTVLTENRPRLDLRLLRVDEASRLTQQIEASKTLLVFEVTLYLSSIL